MAELYDLDAAYAETRQEPFRFKWAGHEWELPHFGDVDWRAAQLADDLKALGDSDGVAEVDIEVLQKLFEYAFGPQQAKRWADVPQNVTAMIKLFVAWQEYGGSSVGESSASSDSSASTGRPSKRTSTGTTKSGSRGRSSAAKKNGTQPES